MKIASSSEKIFATFAARLSRATQRVLFLDYDGTIAPYKAERAEAFPYREVAELLQQIAGETDTRLVIVSGRAARDLWPLLRLNPSPEVWGTHGVERLWPDGRYQQAPFDFDQVSALIAAQHAIDRSPFVSRVEYKPGALAMHWRGLSHHGQKEARNAALLAWREIANQHGLLLADFDGGLELRIPAANKGDAVKRVLDETVEGSIAAFLGDDLSDEDAFRALRGQDLGILVQAQPRKTAAQICIKPEEGVTEFLQIWLRACDTGR